MLGAHNDVTKGAVVNVEIIYGQTLEQSEGKMLFFQFTNAHSIVRIFIDQKDK